MSMWSDDFDQQAQLFDVLRILFVKKKHPKRTVLGDNLRMVRDLAGHTQRSLATQSGVGLTIIHSIESGKTPNPGIYTVLALADALNVSLRNLVR